MNVTTSAYRGSSPGSPEAQLLQPRWTRVRRVALIRREIREYLPPSAVEVLLSEGDTVIEGATEVAGGTRVSDRLFASVMITADLASLEDRFRDRADAATAARVAELLAEHPALAARIEVRVRARIAELAGRADAESWGVTVMPQVRAEGTSILIDADVVAAPDEVE